MHLQVCRSVVRAFNETADVLVEEAGQDADHQALDQVEGDHQEHGEGENVGDGGVDGGAHADQGVDGHAVGHGVGRQEDVGVQEGADQGHHKGACDKADDGPPAGLLQHVNDARRDDHGAPDGKVGDFADEGGGGALDHGLDQDLDQLNEDAGHGAVAEGADEDRYLGKVQLVEDWSDGKRELKEHEDGRDGSEHADGGYLAGLGER